VKILICPDKFKGSLAAKEVCVAVARALHEVNPEAILQSVPLADGGEGTCDLLTDWYGGSKIELEVAGPLFTPVRASYGLSRDGDTAFIEMAVSSGLMLIKPEDRNPLYTTSLGTGELIADAMKRSVKKIVLGIGGSATNDAGMGMATALGYKFCDAEGMSLRPTGENLIHIRYIDSSAVNPLLKSTAVTALCDVPNPFYGPDGAAADYGPQKGASPQDVQFLAAGLRNFRRVVHKNLKLSVDFPGAGAAGGLGAGAKVFLNAQMVKGIRHIIDSTGLVKRICDADLVITGEGKIDQQTFSGKVISEVLRIAETYNKPVIAICGKSAMPEAVLKDHGIKKLISLVDDTTSEESAIRHAAELITKKILVEGQHINALVK
jgi:glycerate 2-kinase